MSSAETVSYECACIVRSAVEMHRSGSIKAAHTEVARQLGITYRRVRSYWNGEVRMVPAHEADLLRRQRRILMEARQARLDAELATIKRQLAEMEATS